MRAAFRVPRSPVVLLVSILLPAPGVLAAQASSAPVHQALDSGDARIAWIPASPVSMDHPRLLPDQEVPALPQADGRAEWILQQGVPRVLTGVSFADPLNGFASAELGAVYKTTNGGETWTTALNIGFPYYWYGVHAFTAQTVVIAGFHNQNGSGILRWSDDGGVSWSADVVVDPANWLLNIRFADAQNGIAYGYQGYVYVTQNGGRTALDWTKIQADPTGGWFAGSFAFGASLDAWVTGISFCRSTDGGMTWTRRASADPVFDGGVSTPDFSTGFTGGGQISAPISGWVHRTTDRGDTWSGRILETAYPIRVLQFFDPDLGFAAGGTRFGDAGGGIWITEDGGGEWALDADTGAEMSGFDWEPVQSDSADVWCVGFLPNLTGVIYKKRIGWLGPSAADDSVPAAWKPTAFPNPFASRTEIHTGGAGALVLDPAGRLVRRLPPATQVIWDGRDERGRAVPAGVYFVRNPSKPGQGVRVVRVR